MLIKDEETFVCCDSLRNNYRWKKSKSHGKMSQN